MKIFLVILSCLFLQYEAFAAVAHVEIDIQDCDGAAPSCTETGHAAGGAGTITLVAQIADDSTASDRDTAGCTMGGNAMTRLANNEIISAPIEMDVYYAVEGTAGDIVCTWAGTVTGAGMITTTYNGIDTVSQPDAIEEDSEVANTVIQQTITTATANAMLVDFVANTIGSSANFTADDGQTQRVTIGIGTLTMSSSEKLSTTAGEYTMGQTTAASGNLVYKIVAIDPEAAAARRRIL